MTKPLILLGLWPCLGMLCHAQQMIPSIGARAMGMAYASGCLSDHWSIFNNVAGLSKVNESTAGFTYESLPSFSVFDRMAAVVVVPTTAGSFGAGVLRFGDDLYNEQAASLAFANKLGLASLGIRVSYVRYRAASVGALSRITISAGGIAELTPHFFIGAQIININQPRISGDTDERVPAWLLLTSMFQPTEKVRMLAELEKTVAAAAAYKAGVEYVAHKKFTVRSGMSLEPRAFFCGLGFKTKKFQLDYAMQVDVFMGLIHQATVNYVFSR